MHKKNEAIGTNTEKGIKKKFEEYSNYIIEEITEIDSMFDAYIGIYNKRVDCVELINMAPAFWGLVMDSFLNYSILMLAKLFDNDNEVISINKYINFVEQNKKYLFSNEINTDLAMKVKHIKKKLEEKENYINKLKYVRDKSVAHNDKNIINKKIDVYEQHNFTIEEIHTLIEMVKEIVNIFWFEYSNIYEVLEATNKGDYEIVFDALKSYRELNI